MVGERKKMELNRLSAPALGVEARSDEGPSAGASSGRLTPPDPEVVARPKRWRFTAEYRLRILEEADVWMEPGDVGRLLRREGLHSSHLTKWRDARKDERTPARQDGASPRSP
jgi:transposase